MKAKSIIHSYKKVLEKIIPCEYPNFKIELSIFTDAERVRRIRFRLYYYSNEIKWINKGNYYWYFVDELMYKSSNNYIPDRRANLSFRNYFLKEKQAKWFFNTCNKYMMILLKNGPDIARL